MQYAIGIDCGSTACKGVLIQENKVVKMLVRTSGWNPIEVAGELCDELTKAGEISRADAVVVATGYGRMNIEFADYRITEITCHAKGAEYMLPGVKTVIDIGGQDSKVIEIRNGKVQNFLMNDKCAAGTGRFLEMTANRLGVDLDGFNNLLEAGKTCSINSMCAVFAESEIVSLLSAGISREEVAGGVIQSIAAKACALAGKISVDTPVVLTGGLYYMTKLREAISDKLGVVIDTNEYARFAGSIGAALIGLEKEKL